MKIPATLIGDLSEYIVKIDRTKDYISILKDSIEQTEIGKDRIFLVKDKASVEYAIEQGAEKYTDKNQIIFH